MSGHSFILLQHTALLERDSMSEPIVEKICTNCKQSLPATQEYFYTSQPRKKTRPRILTAECKICRQTRKKTWYQQNTQRALATE